MNSGVGIGMLIKKAVAALALCGLAGVAMGEQASTLA